MGNKGVECHPVIDCPKHLATIVAIRPLERGRIVGLRETGRTYRRINAQCIGGVSLLSAADCGTLPHP